MTAAWLLVLALACAAAGAEGGSSLRGALEALQRRQRGRAHPPLADYDLYEVLPPNAYVPEPDYEVDIEELEEDPATNYVLKLLEENDRPKEAYEYKLVKKKNSHMGPVDVNRKESAFRERSHHSDNDRLRDLFMDRNEVDNPKEALQERTENDAEYALLLGQLWSKYKNNKAQHNTEGAPQGVVKLYKEKIVKKRYPDNWGPIAFKKKRSPDKNEHPVLTDFEGDSKGLPGPVDTGTYNAYDLSDDDKDDLREEYAIAFQPLDDDSLSDMVDDGQYAYDIIEKRFPVTKRSSGPYDWSKPKKRFAQQQDKHEVSKRFRSSSGTDPKIIKDLSKLFGDSEPELIKIPVKRSSDQQGNSYESKPPQLAMMHQNHSNERSNASATLDDSSHEHHQNLHHPGISGKEIEHTHGHEHVHDHDHDRSDAEKPITVKKKSIDWSTYFGIDKRKQKSVSLANDLNVNKLRKQYFDTFNKEVIYPLNSFRKHSNVKRNYVQRPENEETEIQIDNGEKRNTAQEQESKLDNIDKKLRNMEGMIVDEALHYSNVGEELDTKEEQEMKEKLLSRLAAAYSLEKMRKALKDFKQSLQTQKPDTTMGPSSVPMEEAKEKRVAVKKEKVDIRNNEIPLVNKGDDKEDDFEEEQGAGHYLNGKIENQFSEGYMGGSGRHRSPVVATGSATGACPVLAKIVQRCRGVDLLAGDRGQLFLPLCSLHQICYLCGEAPPTTCDLVFLSEADTACEGDMGCQRAARSALMALRELHDSLADELDGECEASPCLPATLKLNIGWQRALQR